jgi:signal transduction histidine kinase
LMTYVQELVNALGQERESALQDIERLMRSIEHITYVVAHQQSHSGPSSILETVHPHELVREALRLSEEVVKSAGATVVGAHTVVESAALDRSRFLQILVNLIGNAAQAMAGMPVNTRVLTISTDIARVDARKSLRITVEDAGHGITPENLKRIFSHGFTTRDGGHEFGLHSSALAAMEMGGRVLASSAGPGLGAVFTLEVPLK